MKHSYHSRRAADLVPESLAKLVERTRVRVHQFGGGAALGERHQGIRSAPRNTMVSAVSPGPNAIATPDCPGRAFFISAPSTKMTLAEDMFPSRRRTSRDAASAVGGRRSDCSTASKPERPPGWTATPDVSSGRQ